MLPTRTIKQTRGGTWLPFYDGTLAVDPLLRLFLFQCYRPLWRTNRGMFDAIQRRIIS